MSDVVDFPVHKTSKARQEQANESLAQDQNYRFIRDLLTAVSEAGLPMDTDPDQKARELYAKYQQDNTFANWQRQLEEETETE